MAEPEVFLGGVCGNNPWRLDFIKRLVTLGITEEVLFNPVVPNWNAEFAAIEDKVKKTARFLVFYLASPMQEGNPLPAYSMYEATMGLVKRPGSTIVIFDMTGMEGHPLKALTQTMKSMKEEFPYAFIFENPDEAINWFAERLHPATGLI